MEWWLDDFFKILHSHHDRTIMLGVGRLSARGCLARKQHISHSRVQQWHLQLWPALRIIANKPFNHSSLFCSEFTCCRFGRKLELCNMKVDQLLAWKVQLTSFWGRLVDLKKCLVGQALAFIAHGRPGSVWNPVSPIWATPSERIQPVFLPYYVSSVIILNPCTITLHPVSKGILNNSQQLFLI